MKKILYITTVSRTINAFLIPHIQMLKKEGNIVDCACFIDKPIDEVLISNGVNVYDIPFSRNPLHPGNIKAFMKLVNIQRKKKYDIVHVHTPVAGFYGRLLKVKFPELKTIYTVHGFHFYDGAPILNWIIYYPIEMIMSKLTDIMITMNLEDYKRSKTFAVKKIRNINGVGIELSKYNSNNLDKSNIRSKLELNDNDFVILMIAEVNKNKNHRQMIDAIEILKNKGINNIKVICAGDGIMMDDIKKIINKKKLESNIKMLGFRNDINELIVACDIGILMSYREGLPRNIMEFMACKKSVIGTNVRGIKDLIINGVNGYIVELDDAIMTSKKIETLYNNKDLINRFNRNAIKNIDKYSIQNVMKEIKEVTCAK